LYLLMHTDQAQFNDLSADCWSKWAASVVAYPNDGSQDSAYFTLVRLAYQKAPIQTISALESMLGRAKHNQRPINLERFVNCWDEKLNTLIVNQLIDQPEFSRYHESLLESLIERKVVKAEELALDLLNKHLTKSNLVAKKERLKVKIAARILLENADSTIWPSIWQFILGDQKLGRDIIESIHTMRLKDPKFKLTESQLADFYLWLTEQYPEIDRKYEDFYELQFADYVKRLRDRILRMLEQGGTLLACQEILRLSAALPELPWLKQVHLNARNVTLRSTWQPYEPRTVLDLITKHKIQEMEHKRDPKIVNNTINVDSINANGDGNIFNIGPDGNNLGGFTPPKKEKSWQFWLMFGLTAIGTVAAIVDIPSQHLNKIKSLFKGNVVPELEQVKPPKVNR
jgi:hypothetical protein